MAYFFRRLVTISILRSILSVVLLVTVAGATPIRNSGDGSKDPEKPSYYLPKNVKPTNYNIKLIPHIIVDNFTFEGESVIDITVIESFTHQIILHAKDLNFDKNFTSLTNAKNITVKPVTTELNDEIEVVIFHFNDSITHGRYKLHLKYIGVLNNKLTGFYRSSYRNDKDKEVWLASTHFKPTYARQAFPCFDEPAMKATFEIAINHFTNYTAVSNMPKVNDSGTSGDIQKDNKHDKIWTKFEVTPKMSTYLVAFVISDFKFVSSSNKELKIWSRPNAIESGEYAAQVGTDGLKYLEEFTGSKYQLPKIDNFAIPQFIGSAMENWGLVTYRESLLLLEQNASTAMKQKIATTICHKLAQQWFGNLVTPKWWNNVWLTEGFANYLENYIMNKIKPSWRLMEQFVVVNMQAIAFQADDDENQHSMNSDVDNPVSIKKKFDDIAYSKAGSVIRMISHALGAKNFESRLQKYLKSSEFSSATSDDLFKALSEKEENGTAWNSWTSLPGYPVINVSRIPEKESMIIRQRRYLSVQLNTDSHQELWKIPINYATQNNPNFNVTHPEIWLNEKANEFPLVLKNDEWLIVNKNQTGYYRVNYEPSNWKLLANYLRTENYTKIPPVNRAQLLDDAFNLVQSGDLEDFSTFFDISTGLQQEDDYIPWYSAFRAFEHLKKKLANTDIYDLFQLYILKLINKLEITLAYDNVPTDDHITKLNRITAMKWACDVGSESCRKVAHEKLIKYINFSSVIPADLRSVIVCTGIRTANQKTWNETFSVFKKTKDENERSMILIALGCSSDVEILTAYLKKTLDSNSEIPHKYHPLIFKTVISENNHGVDAAFDFIKENIGSLIETGGKNELVLSYLSDIASRMTTQPQVEKLKKFIESLRKEHKDVAKALETKALLEAGKNMKWVKNYKPQITSFLKQQHLIATVNPELLTTPDEPVTTIMTSNTTTKPCCITHQPDSSNKSISITEFLPTSPSLAPSMPGTSSRIPQPDSSNKAISTTESLPASPASLLSTLGMPGTTPQTGRTRPTSLSLPPSLFQQAHLYHRACPERPA